MNTGIERSVSREFLPRGSSCVSQSAKIEAHSPIKEACNTSFVDSA